jgi:hypothetical protein
VLIIDDASTDESERVGRQLAESDRRVEFRRHTVNKGHIATYNEGLLEWAVAPYSLLLSADDALAPGALARAVRLMNAHPEVGMTCGRAMIVGDDDVFASDVGRSDDAYFIMAGGTYLQHCCSNLTNPISTPTAVVRTELQRLLGGYRADLPHSGDMEMWMRFATQSAIGMHRAIQAYYRWHGRNMSRLYYATMLNDLKERKAACMQALTWCNDSEGKRLLRVVSQRSAIDAFWIASKAFDAGDTERSRFCLEFAKAEWPDLERSREWKRFRAKTSLGVAVWRRIRPTVNRLRGMTPAPDSLKTEQFRIGGITGWWPGDTAPGADRTL